MTTFRGQAGASDPATWGSRRAHLQVCQPHVRLEAMEAPSSASMPELMPSHIAHIAYVVMSKLTTRQLILTLFPAFFLILVLHMCRARDHRAGRQVKCGD